MSDHTPGPWWHETARDNPDAEDILTEEHNERIAEVIPFDVGPEFVCRNACLIAAAPDMLAALEAIDRYFAGLAAATESSTVCRLWSEIGAAIAKAKGEAT